LQRGLLESIREPDPEFWRTTVWSTQPSADDAASDPGRRLSGQRSYAAAPALCLVFPCGRHRPWCCGAEPPSTMHDHPGERSLRC